MKREGRNRTIDIFRAIAILAVLIYHFYYFCDYPYQAHTILNRFLGIGGELGVTLFFIISGFGIAASLQNMEEKEGKISAKRFLQKRFLRILPQYYACIGILLLLTSSAQYVNKKGLFDVFTHVIFIHNWFPSTHGSINGVLWSMGTIFQFYIVAVWVKKIFDKNKWLTVGGAVLISVGLKILFYHWILPARAADASWYFIYARQIFTALDNFLFGMLLHSLLQSDRIKWRKGSAAAGAVVSLGFCCWWILLLIKYSPYADNLMGYIWHTVFAFGLTVLMYFICALHFSWKGIVSRIILWISKYQYGTYIRHFVVTSTLLTYSSAIQIIARNSFIIFSLSMTVLCCFVGYASTVFFETVSYREEWKKIKEDFSKKQV